MKYSAWDDSGYRVDIEADSAREAAEEYVSGGDYSGGDGSPISMHVAPYVRGRDEKGRFALVVSDDIEHFDIAIEAEEPDCSADEHDWQAPIEVVGGIAENPGVWGHGGGVIIREVCAHCGRYRVVDTWATNPSNGTTYESTRYEDADKTSTAWVESLSVEAE